jgi:hypothetical protein
VSSFKGSIFAAYGANYDAFENIPFIQQFEASMRGYKGLPVLYPRASPSDDVPVLAPTGADENFKWFMRSRKEKIELPPMTGRAPLPWRAEQPSQERPKR